MRFNRERLALAAEGVTLDKVMNAVMYWKSVTMNKIIKIPMIFNQNKIEGTFALLLYTYVCLGIIYYLHTLKFQVCFGTCKYYYS